MKMTRQNLLVAIATSSLALVALNDLPQAKATVVHGDRFGVTVDYLNISETTQTAGDPEPLFGAPTITGDSLDFDPQGFSAEAVGDTTDQTDSQLTFDVEAKDGFGIEKLLLTEAGDTSLSRALSSAADAFTKVSAFVFVEINEIDFQTVNQINLGPLDMTFTNSGEWLLSTDGGGSPVFAGGFSGSLFVELDAELASRNIDGTVTGITVSLDNKLVASAEDGSTALIAKKDFDSSALTVEVDTMMIPEPTAAVLALCGLFAASGIRVRRS